MTSKKVHAMTPQELADQGIPVEVALRARIEGRERFMEENGGFCRTEMSARCDAYEDALAVIRAKGTS